MSSKRWYYTIPLRLRSVFRRKDVEKELTEEFEYHLERQVEQNISNGMSLEEARYMALRVMGGIEQRKEQCREKRGVNIIDHLRQDLDYGVRMLRRNPGFTVVAILTLALGTGANTAVFSLVHRVLIAYLPVSEPERLMVISRTNLEEAGVTGFPHLFFRELDAERDVFDGVLCRGGSERVTVGTEEGGEPARCVLVSGGYFEVMGVKPHVGRLLTRGDDVTPGAHPVVVLGYKYWQRRFGGDPSVVGTTIRLSGYPMTIIGVSPPGFDGLDPGQTTDLRVPMSMQAELRRAPLTLNQRNARELNIVGRLKRGVSVEQAQQVVTARLRRYLDAGEAISEQNRRIRETERVELLPAATGFGKTRQQFQASLQALMTITIAVLLITCLNLANLMLAKSSARELEFAVRRAVGAKPSRLVQQLLTESILLALCGAALGVILAYPGSSLLMKLVSGNESGFRLDTQPNMAVLLFHLGTAVVCGILFGLAPALGTRQQSLTPGMKGAATSRGWLTTRKVLVSAQVALSVIVLVGAGLFLRTVHAMQTADIGFRSDHLLGLALSPKNAGLSDAEVLPFFRATRDRVSALPGVTAVTFSVVRTLAGNAWRSGVVVEDFTPSGNTPQPSRDVVGPDYFHTLGIPLVAGRDFVPSDNATASKVAVVNESFASLYFAGKDPLGRKIGATRPEYTIVGVVRDSKYAHIRETTQRIWYVPYEQQPSVKYMNLYVRTVGKPEAQINAVRAAIASVDKSVALFNVWSQETQIEELLLAERMLATLATFFGITASALAALGLYGVLAFLVTQRYREIGIRMALGAEPRDVLRMVMARGMTLTIGGIAVGLLAALALAQLVASLLFGIEASDPFTFAGASLLLVVVALLACYIPARRATKVDPMTALRYE